MNDSTVYRTRILELPYIEHCCQSGLVCIGYAVAPAPAQVTGRLIAGTFDAGYAQCNEQQSACKQFRRDAGPRGTLHSHHPE